MKKTLLFLCILFMSGLVCYSQTFNEMVNLSKYRMANTELPLTEEGVKRVVFIGNSITEGWVNMRPDFFIANNYVGRGIGGQTSPQLVLRFRQDVIDLKPYAVVINIGTNDIAENTGAYNPDFTFGNIQSMAEMARANGIRVILSSILPVGEYPWRKEIKNVPQTIDALNTRIEAYAKANKFYFIDYNKSMRDSKGALIESYGYDGVHPNAKGYEIMEVIAKEVIDEALR